MPGMPDAPLSIWEEHRGQLVDIADGHPDSPDLQAAVVMHLANGDAAVAARDAAELALGAVRGMQDVMDPVGWGPPYLDHNAQLDERHRHHWEAAYMNYDQLNVDVDQRRVAIAGLGLGMDVYTVYLQHGLLDGLWAFRHGLNELPRPGDTVHGLRPDCPLIPDLDYQRRAAWGTLNVPSHPSARPGFVHARWGSYSTAVCVLQYQQGWHAGWRMGRKRENAKWARRRAKKKAKTAAEAARRAADDAMAAVQRAMAEMEAGDAGQDGDEDNEDGHGAGDGEDDTDEGDTDPDHVDEATASATIFAEKNPDPETSNRDGMWSALLQVVTNVVGGGEGDASGPRTPGRRLTAMLNTASCYPGHLRGSGCGQATEPAQHGPVSSAPQNEVPGETRWGRYWREARKLEAAQLGSPNNILKRSKGAWNPWHAALLVAEFVGMIAAVALMYQRQRGSRRSKPRRRAAANTTSSRSRSGGRDNSSHNRERRKDGRKAPFTTDPAGHRKWQRHIEAQAMKKGISIAILLGWINSPHEQESKAVEGSTSEASQVIGVARRMSSLGLDKANTKEQVTRARSALAATEDAMRAEDDASLEALVQAQQRLGAVYETKGGEEDYEAQLLAAKEALEKAKTARAELASTRDARIAEVARLRAALEAAILADSAAPAVQAPTPTVAASGTKDGKAIKDMLAPLQLADQSNLSKQSWQEIWPELARGLQKKLWSRGLSQLYQIILSTLDDHQKTLITAANSNDQQDGLMAYKILRSHCYGSKEEWIAKLWHTVQNWTQDRGARKELGRPRKLLDALMMFEADLADFEETGEAVSERAKLIILKEGLARRQKPALEKIKNDLSGQTWDYQRTVNWLLTWDREHQAEIKKGEAELMAAWRSARRSSSATTSRATANMARGPAPRKGKCYICGESGHWARNCPKRATANAAAALGGAGPGGRNTFRCFNCGQTGHAARDCPLPPQPRKCFICGSDKHLQKDCPQKGSTRDKRSQDGGRKQGGGRPPARRNARPAAARAATAKKMSISRDNLKNLVKYVNAHKHHTNFTLSMDASGAIGAVADTKPAPASLVAIPMPVDTDTASEVAAILAENNATLPILDSGASKSTVPMWYELCDERRTDINIQCAGEGQTMRCETEGDDGLLGPAMKVETSTPLLAIRPLDERGVAVLFMNTKVYAINSRHLQGLIASAVKNNHGREIGRSKPDWVYELTDRRSLEEVLRGADAGLNTAVPLKRARRDPRPLRKLTPTPNADFDDHDFDPTVYPDEAVAERARQWRNTVRRSKVEKMNEPLAVASASGESSGSDISDVHSVTGPDAAATAAAVSVPPNGGATREHSCARCSKTTFASNECAFCDSDSETESDHEVHDKPGVTATYVAETPPKRVEATAAGTVGIVAESPKARRLFGGMQRGATALTLLTRKPTKPVPQTPRKRRKAKCGACGMIHRSGACPAKQTPGRRAPVPKKKKEAQQRHGNPAGRMLSTRTTADQRVRKRSRAKKAPRPTCSCIDCKKKCHWSVDRRAYSDKCSTMCKTGNCGHDQPSAIPLLTAEVPGGLKYHKEIKIKEIASGEHPWMSRPESPPQRGGPQSKHISGSKKGSAGTIKPPRESSAWTENAAEQTEIMTEVKRLLRSHGRAFVPPSCPEIREMTNQEHKDRHNADRSQHGLRLALVLRELIVAVDFYRVLTIKRATLDPDWKKDKAAVATVRNAMNELNYLRTVSRPKAAQTERRRAKHHERMVYRMLTRRMSNLRLTAVRAMVSAKRKADAELTRVAKDEFATHYGRKIRNWHISTASKRAKMTMRKIDKTLTPSAKAAAMKQLSYVDMVPMEKPPRIKGSWTRKKHATIMRGANRFLSRQEEAEKKAYILLHTTEGLGQHELQEKVIKVTDFDAEDTEEDRNWIRMTCAQVYHKYCASRAASADEWSMEEHKATECASEMAAQSLLKLRQAVPGGIKTPTVNDRATTAERSAPTMVDHKGSPAASEVLKPHPGAGGPQKSA